MYLKGYNSAVNTKTHAAITTIHLGHLSHLKETLSYLSYPYKPAFYFQFRYMIVSLLILWLVKHLTSLTFNKGMHSEHIFINYWQGYWHLASGKINTEMLMSLFAPVQQRTRSFAPQLGSDCLSS